MSEEDDRVSVSFDEAMGMMPDGDEIHTFRSTGPMLIGADWPRGKIIDAVRQFGIELSGPSATSMGHGLVIIDERGPLFIATR